MMKDETKFKTMIEEYEKLDAEFAASQVAHYEDSKNGEGYLKWIGEHDLPENFSTFAKYETRDIGNWSDFKPLESVSESS